MKIEKQVCSIEQAKRLKELGVSQESLFSYLGDEKDINLNLLESGSNVSAWVWVAATVPVNNMDLDNREDLSITQPIAAAYTVAELFKMLPYSITDENGAEYIQSNTKDFDHYSGSMSYTVGYYNFDKHSWYYGAGTSTVVESAADMLIRLIEHEKTTVTEINERLASAE
jgi:hypothetical protein